MSSGYNAQLSPLALDTMPILPLVDLRPSLGAKGKTNPVQTKVTPRANQPFVLATLKNNPIAQPTQNLPRPTSELAMEEVAPPAHNSMLHNTDISRPGVRPLNRLHRQEASPSFYMSLSDLMCLLLVFFVLIFSLTEKGGNRVITPEASLALAATPQGGASVPDPFPQPAQLSNSLRRGLMGLTALGQADPGLTNERIALASTTTEIADTRFSSQDEIHHQLLSQVRAETSEIAGLEVAVRGESVLVRMPEMLLFDLGKASLNPSLQPTLANLGKVLQNFPQASIKITGHTDDRPISTPQFASNWELSGARAAVVARALVQGGSDPSRITILGMADQSPLLPNINDNNRSRNRRVEVEFELSQLSS